MLARLRDLPSTMDGTAFFSNVSKVATVVTVGAAMLWTYGLYQDTSKRAAAKERRAHGCNNNCCSNTDAQCATRPTNVLMQDGHSDDVYASEEYLSKYMEFSYADRSYHFFKTYKIRSIADAFDFHERLAKKFANYLSQNDKPLRGLDIGCATGASTFHMARYFTDGVIGIDRSAPFIQAARQVKDKLLENKAITFAAPLQGDIVERFAVTMPKEVREHAACCEFYVGDCMDLFDANPAPTAAEEDNSLAGTQNGNSSMKEEVLWKVKPGVRFTGVLCANVLDRVPDPMRLVDSFDALIEPGGILVLTDPYSWDASVTPQAKWLGGKDGRRSEGVVKALLTRRFRLVEESDEAFLIRDHVRRYQLGLSHCTVWQKL